MITIRPANARGVTDFGWLDSRHSFSFGEYRDPANMGFRTLRVINDDRVAPGGGFPTHPHRDMEIVTWVLEGALEHKDSLGTGSVIRAGDLQRMTAGTGIFHSEFNPSPTEAVRLLQIWIFPEARGLVPGYDQRSFPAAERIGQLKLVASRTGRDGSISMAQNADLFAAALLPEQTVTHTFEPGRSGWVQVATGSVCLNGQILKEGDGAAITDESKMELTGVTSGETLVFDLK
ncbi:pirin family protein [Zavarzinella formosa]|uniref:pirin family protein n=1 Tax=Zavarzinella formosa TaxID=360055 RepID=UPI0002EB34CF|nr:pirin family protein [Zavarzinella formosa]